MDCPACIIENIRGFHKTVDANPNLVFNGCYRAGLVASIGISHQKNGVEMHMNNFQIALASLIGNPGPLAGWETDIVNKLGKVDERSAQAIALASDLSAGGIKSSGKAALLQSIFDHLSLSNAKSKNSHYYAPGALSLEDDSVFAKPIQDGGKEKPNFDHLRDEMKQAIPTGKLETAGEVDEILSALYRTTSNIPSSILPGVSHYEHQRMSAALTICLLEKTNGDKAFSVAPDESVALLVGGDISGIQDFIYTIRAKGAARTLRGRSFYLQLLTEAVLRFVLRGLELPYTNVIYSGGGHFFLLAPPSKQQKVEELQQQISSILLKHHGTSLYLALGSATVPRRGFEKGNFPEYWGKMHASLAQRKRQRYSEMGAETYTRVFALKNSGGNPNNTCDVCGEDHRDLREWKHDGEDQKGKICTLCASFEEMGGRLPKSNFIALGIGSPAARDTDDAKDILAEFGMTIRFVEDARETFEMKGDQVALWAFDDPVGGKWPSVEGAAKWLRYTANKVPDLSFDELQKKVDGGLERLGVLRMDVDNLGDLFKRGLGDQATLTQLATLSFRTSLFFEGWLKKLCEKYKDKDDNNLIYTVYAGGDDLFLIGPWDVIPNLAQEIVRDFAKYTGENPDLHASAGMAFIDGKYPVYQAAEDAKDALETAKDVTGKNAFTFLGQAWSWQEFTTIAEKKERLHTLVSPKEDNKKEGPKAILQVLQQLAVDEQQHGKVKGHHVWGRWMWMGMYQLTRMQERNKELAQEIKSISDGLHDNQYQDIDQWGLAARWAELHGRKKKEAVK
jgi:CRISPR-associated protein Csm1